MKKILVFLLVLTLALAGLVSCTPDNNDGGSEQGGNTDNNGGNTDNNGGNTDNNGGNTDNNGGNTDNNQGSNTETESYTVHFKNNDGWSAVNVYIWLTAGETDTLYTAAWPGSAMTAGEDGWYSFSFDTDTVDGVKLIFNDGTNQTADLLFDSERIWWANGTAYAEKADAEQSKLDSITLYYKNINGWETPHFHAWNSTGAVNTWPGVAMTKVEGTDDWYSVEAQIASLEGLGYLFCDGSGEGSVAAGNQTADIIYTADKLYYSNGRLYASIEDAENNATTTTYADLYIRGSHNSWGTDSAFVLNEDGSRSITVDLAAGTQFKISNNAWTEQIDYTNAAFQSNSNFDWGTDSNNIKVVTAGNYTFTVASDGTLTIKKN